MKLDAPTLEDIKIKKQVDDLSYEYGKLLDWFYESWPEGTCRLEVNSDQRIGTLNYKITVFTGKEATPLNQGMMTHTMTFTKWDMLNDQTMDKVKKELVPKYKEGIKRKMNEFTRLERERMNSL